jgi:tetratricopeptide (TPR) repeat protein
VLVEQGNLAAALDTYKAALAIRERLARERSSDANAQQLPSVSLNKIGDVLRLQGNLAAALHSYKDSLAIRERLAKAYRSNAETQRDLLVAQQNVGDVRLRPGDQREAMDGLARMISRLE